MEYVGIDFHKRYSFVARVNATGKILSQRKVSNDRPTLTRFVRSLKPGTKLALEATGHWMYFYELLEDRQADLVLAHPLKTKAIASARIKTDKIDATTLAHLLRADLLPAAYIPPRPMRDLRELLRYRASLVVLRSVLKNKLQAVLLKHGWTCPWRNVLAKRARPWWQTLPLRPCYREAVTGFLAVAGSIEQQLATTTQTVAGLAAAEPQAQLLQTIPGIGPYAALLILSEIGEVARFRDPKQLCAYAGLVPSVHSSGGHTRHGRLTKQGSKWLRWILVEVAWHTVRKVPAVRTFYQRVAARRGPNVAKVAVARRLLVVIHRMLTRHEPFTGAAPASSAVS
jgi:transposase